MKTTITKGNEINPKLILPPKIKVYNNFMDSTRWERIVQFFENDIVVGSHMKAGTTLLQAIIGYILYEELNQSYDCKTEEIPISDISPFVDLIHRRENEVKELLDNQNHRRFMKTHLPFNALPYSQDESVKYIYVVRNFLDIFMSAYDKYAFNAKDEFFEALNSVPGIESKIIKPTSINQFYNYMAANDWGFPGWSYFDNVKTWFDNKQKDNVMIVHYDDLVNQRRNKIKEISEYLGVNLEEKIIDYIAKITSFEYMQKHGQNATPDKNLWKDPNKFYNKGVNGRWKEVLSPSQIRLYDLCSRIRLGTELSDYVNRF
ncbi:MAG: sulfotransferase domain-containing protein [Candidatus Woesearchaeota archaeon]